MIATIREHGTTVIIVEQSVNLALTIAETAYFMEKGEIRFHGPTAELLERPDILRSVFLEGVGARPGAPAAAQPVTDGCVSSQAAAPSGAGAPRPAQAGAGGEAPHPRMAAPWRVALRGPVAGNPAGGAGS